MGNWVAGEPHICLGGCLDIWFTDPPGLVTVARPGAHFTEDVGEALSGPIMEKLLTLHRLAPVPMCFLHDWRHLCAYDSSVRMKLVRLVLDLGRERIQNIEVLLAPDTPKLVRMGVTVASSAVGVAGLRLNVYPDASTRPPGKTLLPHPKVRPFALLPDPRRPGRLRAQTRPPGALSSLPPTSLPPTSLPPTSLPPASLPPTSLPQAGASQAGMPGPDAPFSAERVTGLLQAPLSSKS